MAISFVLSEIIPFIVVVYGIYLQIDWNKNTSDYDSENAQNT